MLDMQPDVRSGRILGTKCLPVLPPSLLNSIMFSRNGRINPPSPDAAREAAGRLHCGEMLAPTPGLGRRESGPRFEAPVDGQVVHSPPELSTSCCAPIGRNFQPLIGEVQQWMAITASTPY